jgi:uncharacterized protein with GYD domain
MSIFIVQGRFTREAIAGMAAKPEDRRRTVGALFRKAGGKLLYSWLTFGEYDFIVIADMPSAQHMATAVIAASAGGGITEVKTMAALDWSEAQKAFGAAGKLIGGFRSAGGAGSP